MNSLPTVARFTEGRPQITVGLLCALGLALRLVFLGCYSLWLDEAISVEMASSGFSAILQDIYEREPHPPLYYLLLHWWQNVFGTSEFVVRLPSALLGALSIPLIYGLARAWFGQRTALVAAVVLTVSPLHVWYSQEARMYSLLAFLGLASLLALSRILQGGRLSWLPVYVLSMLAGLYTHYGMMIMLGTQVLFVLGWWRVSARGWRRPGLAALAQALALTGFLPWLPVLAQRARDTTTIGELGLFSRLSSFAEGLPGLPAVALLVILAGTIALIPWLWKARTSPEQLGNRLALVVLGAYALVTIISASSIGTMVKRHTMIFLPVFFVLAGAGINTLARGRRPATILLIILSCSALLVSYTQREMQDWRGAGHLVSEAGQSGDVILLHAAYTDRPFEYYYRDGLPRVGVSHDQYEMQLSNLKGKYGRAWVIFSQEVYADPQQNVRRWMGQNWQRVRQSEFKGVTVALYSIPQGIP